MERRVVVGNSSRNSRNSVTINTTGRTGGGDSIHPISAKNLATQICTTVALVDFSWSRPKQSEKERESHGRTKRAADQDNLRQTAAICRLKQHGAIYIFTVSLQHCPFKICGDQQQGQQQQHSNKPTNHTSTATALKATATWNVKPSEFLCALIGTDTTLLVLSEWSLEAFVSERS